MCPSEVQCGAVWCSVLQRVAVWCSVVQCVAVSSSSLVESSRICWLSTIGWLPRFACLFAKQAYQNGAPRGLQKWGSFSKRRNANLGSLLIVAMQWQRCGGADDCACACACAFALLQCVAVCCSVLQCTNPKTGCYRVAAVHRLDAFPGLFWKCVCSVMSCVAVRCSALRVFLCIRTLQCVAVCCSVYVPRHVAMGWDLIFLQGSFGSEPYLCRALLDASPICAGLFWM